MASMRESSEFEWAPQEEREQIVQKLLDFIDQTAAAISAVQLYHRYNGFFAADYMEEQADELSNDLPRINEVIAILGGIDVDFVDTLDGERKSGRIMGFANLDITTLRWDLALREKDHDKIIPVKLSSAELREAALNGVDE